MSSKDDFIDWDALNLQELFEGEYTEYDEYSAFEDDIDENVAVNADSTDISNKRKSKSDHSNQSKKRSTSSVKDPDIVGYKCPDCDKIYKSIAGFRGHMTKKHNKHRLRATDYRTDRSADDKFPVVEADKIEDIINNSFTPALKTIAECPFRNNQHSRHGKDIVDIANKVRTNEYIQQKVVNVVKPVFVNIFSQASETVTECSENEVLFNCFYNVTLDTDLVDQLREEIDVESGACGLFISVFFDQLLSSIINARAQHFVHKTDFEAKSLTDNDQNVLFYISGYIVSKLEKDVIKLRKKSPNFTDEIQKFVKNTDNSEKTFVDKYSTWTNKLNRGGLKLPSDDMFLLVREIEMVVRQNVDVDTKCITSSTFDRARITETVMSKFMVKHYLSKLGIADELSPFFIERIIRLFLTIRGFSVARSIKGKLQVPTKDPKSKPLRKVLKEKSLNASRN